jgi:(p)ppGpp synthase/HD superfamily hydrolase
MSLTSRFDAALAFASDFHRSQVRKGTKIPYISHPLAVAAIVMEHGGDEDEAIAALLHDVIEDGGGPSARTEISAHFGERVARIVDGCTDTDQQPKPPWRERKEAYITHLRNADPSGALVSAADKLHNARSIMADYRVQGEALWKRFNPDADQVWYYGAVVDALRANGNVPPNLMQALEETVAELAALVEANR